MARPHIRTALAALGAALLVAACSQGAIPPGAMVLTAASGPIESTIRLTSGGVARTFILDVPRGAAPAGGWPLILLLHGGGGTAEALGRHTRGFPTAATVRGYVVARPQGLDKQWHDGRAGVGSADDVTFLAAVVVETGRRVPVNPARVYAAGISNGAMMTGRLACTPTFRLAAVAQVAGTIGVGVAPGCQPAGPVSVLMIMGRADPIVPYAGGNIRVPFSTPGSRGAVVGAQAYAASWVARLRTPTTSTTIVLAPDARANDTRGAGGTEVEFATVDDGGHGWPGGLQYLPKAIVGTVVQTFSANDVILDFFDRHS